MAPTPTPPTIAANTSRKQAEGAVVVSSLVVGALYAYRKLIEPVTVKPNANEPALRKIIGLEPKPAGVAQFAVAYGFVFLSLSVAAVAVPEVAAAFAVLMAVGYTLTNGASVFTDITHQVSKGQTPTLAQQLEPPGSGGAHRAGRGVAVSPATFGELQPLRNPPVNFPLNKEAH